MLITHREISKLSVHPAGPSPQKRVFRLEFLKNKLLQEKLSVFLVLNAMRHVSGKQSEGMHDSFFAPLVQVLLLHLLHKQVEIARKVLTNFYFPRLSDVAYSLDQVLVCSLHVPAVAVVYLEPDVLYLVLTPQLHFIIAHQ